MKKFLAFLILLCATLFSASSFAESKVGTVNLDDSELVIPVSGEGGISLQFENSAGAWTPGTIFVETQVEIGARWAQTQVCRVDGTPVSSITASGVYRLNVAGIRNVRVRVDGGNLTAAAAVVMFSTKSPVPDCLTTANVRPLDPSTTNYTDSLSVGLAHDSPPFNLGPAASGGLPHPCMVYSEAGDTAETVCLPNAGQLYKIECTNKIAATEMWLQVFDMSTEPIAGTSTAVKNIGIPGHASIAGFVTDYYYGERFSNGIGVAITGGIGKLDNTNAVAGAACMIYYVSQ